MASIFNCSKAYCKLIRKGVDVIPCKWHFVENLCETLISHRPHKHPDLDEEEYFETLREIINCPNLKDHLPEKVIYDIRCAYLSKGGDESTIVPEIVSEEESDD